jgi:signal transduction histidine kinase
MESGEVRPRAVAGGQAGRRPVRKAAAQKPAGRAAKPSTLSGLFSLRSKLIIPYLLVTFLGATIGIYTVTRLVASSVRERFVNQLFEASRIAGEEVSRQERTHLANLRLMAFTEGVPQAALNRDRAALEGLLFPLVLNNDMEAISVIDQSGVEILSIAKNPNPDPEHPYIYQEGANFSSLPLAANILQGVQDSTGDKFVGLLETSYGVYYFTSAPIVQEVSSQKQLTGVIMVGTRLASLINTVQAKSNAQYTFILGLDGHLLSSTFAGEPEEADRLALKPEQVTSLDKSFTRTIELGGRSFQAAYSPLIIRDQMTGVLGVVLSSDYVVEAEATSRYRLSLIFAGGLMGVIVMGYILAQSIARPIMKLRRISQAVAAGDLNQASGLRRSDEIGELATAFDVMTYQLRKRTEQAARLYAETIKRNQELADANAKLQSAQQQLVQSEKLAAVGQLTAGIVHDVKNPLAVIKGLAEELREARGIDPASLDQLNIIRDNASRANTIVTDLLKFARQSTPESKLQDIRETVNSAVRLTAYLARKGKVEVVTDLPKGPVMVMYDAQQLEQVLINLIQNAIQAMPHGGTLRANVSVAEGAVGIAVQDSGIGIPKENLSRIFDPFFTTKPAGEGTGLGLSVSFGIVSRHGGRIDVTSQVGKGSTFTVLLPVRQPTATK